MFISLNTTNTKKQLNIEKTSRIAFNRRAKITRADVDDMCEEKFTSRFRTNHITVCYKQNWICTNSI